MRSNSPSSNLPLSRRESSPYNNTNIIDELLETHSEWRNSDAIVKTTIKALGDMVK
mgnify:CR=1 FL=1